MNQNQRKALIDDLILQVAQALVETVPNGKFHRASFTDSMRPHLEKRFLSTLQVHAPIATDKKPKRLPSPKEANEQALGIRTHKRSKHNN